MGNKEFRFDLRLTEEEKVDLYARAAADKLKPAIYARKLLFPSVAPVAPPVATEAVPPLAETPEPLPEPPRELPPDPPKVKRNYTGDTAMMFHRKQYEYLDEHGKRLWTTEAP